MVTSSLTAASHQSSGRRLSRTFANREYARFCFVFGAVVGDLGSLVLASSAAAVLRYGGLYSDATSVLLLSIWPAYFLASVIFRSYSLEIIRNAYRSSWRATLALLTATGLTVLSAFALHASNEFSRLETAFLLLFGISALTIVRALIALALSRVRGILEARTILLGDDAALAVLPGGVDVFNVTRLKWKPDADDPDFLNLICSAMGDADRVLLLFDKLEDRVAWTSFIRLTGVNAELVEPQMRHAVPSGIGSWRGTPTLVISRGPMSGAERAAKRALDLVCTALLGVLVAPLVAILAIAIKLESPGPCLFVQERVGRKNSRYKCYKLRTMRSDDCNPTGSVSASRDDRRVTRLGRFLRKTSLDELPQLWNVLVGDMSVVGPRPHPLGATAEGAYFWQVVQTYWTRHAVKPGLTGLAQVRGFRGATLRLEDIEQRVLSDLEYINTWSIGLDIKILVRTPFVLIHKNAF